MSDVDIGKKGAVDYEGLTKRLPSGVNGLYAENEVRSPELTIAVEKNFGSKDKIEIPHVDRSDILGEHRAVCNTSRIDQYRS